MAQHKHFKAIIGFSLIPDFIILDQLSKWLILDYVFRPELRLESLGLMEWIKNTEQLPFVSIEIFSNFNLSMVWNHGVSFGMFQTDNPWPLIIMAVIISAIFSVWLCKAKSWVETISLSLIIGGALGNVIDRFHYGAVADFFDFYIGNWHYPAFNLADSFISVGIVILIAHSLISSDFMKKETK
ncbi:MAG: signal peptidase II [Pseudomonadota bacterium]